MINKIKKFNYLTLSLLFLISSFSLIYLSFLNKKEQERFSKVSQQLINNQEDNSIQKEEKKEVIIQVKSGDDNNSNNSNDGYKEGNQNKLTKIWEQTKEVLKEKLLTIKNFNSSTQVLSSQDSTSSGNKENVQLNSEVKVFEKDKEIFSFALLGDLDNEKEQLGFSSKLESVLSQIAEFKTNFVIFTGDLVSLKDSSYSSAKFRIESLKKTIEGKTKNYFITFGEEDLGFNQKETIAKLWQEIFWKKNNFQEEKPKLFFSFDYGNTHFVLLSSNFPLYNSIEKEQLDWLREDLAKTSKINKIVVSHVPPVNFFEKSANNNHDMSVNPNTQKQLWKIFKDNQVDLVLSGHEQAFDHKIVEGIDYVLVGSIEQEPLYKGIIKDDIFSLVFVNKNKIFLRSMRLNGREVRTIEIK